MIWLQNVNKNVIKGLEGGNDSKNTNLIQQNTSLKMKLAFYSLDSIL
jgi:hypothetical protein